MYGLYVFDLDGTLVDSRRDIAESANALLETCDVQALPEAVIGRMVGNGAPTLVARVFSAAGVAPPADALERFLEIYDARLLEHTRPYPQMTETLEALSRCAHLAVLTNKPRAATVSILTGLNLAQFFSQEAIVAGDGPFARKPDPSGLRHLVSRACVLPQGTLMVGDSLVDWQTARQAATAVCLARYGFGFEEFPVGDLRPDDHVIDQPSALLRL